jgi:spermidine synthase
MIPWILLDTAKIPGGGELRLMRRGDEFSIRLGSNELMNSRRGGSEKALAELPCERLRSRRKCRVLIGGLGMGFTLRAALGVLDADAEIVVCEIVPAVVAWARGPMAHMSANSLSDPRLDMHEGDVGHAIGSARARFDAILLDVDNGPEGLSRNANDRLYDGEGLKAAHRALSPGGILAVWSSAPSEHFVRLLRRADFGVEEVKVRANAKRAGAHHVVWLATKGSAA